MFKEIVAISKNYAMVRIEGISNEDLLNMNLKNINLRLNNLVDLYRLLWYHIC